MEELPNRPVSIFAMTIDPKSGDMRIGEVCFGSELTENDFLNSNIGRLGKLVSSTADYHWYEIWVLDPSGREAGITLRFTAGEKLQQIRLKTVKSRDSPTRSVVKNGGKRDERVPRPFAIRTARSTSV